MTTEQRLERLERQNGRLKRGMIGMVVAGLSLLVMGQTLPPKVHDVVKAKKFEVVRDDGRTMVEIFSGPEFGMIVVRDKKNPVVGIGADDRGNARISLYSPKGKELAYIGATKSGHGALGAFSLKGKELAYIGANKEGDGLVGINDSAGKRLMAIGADKDGEGRVFQFNRAGKTKAEWPPLR